MAVEAFVFDCGGVLLTHRDGSTYEAWERRLGLRSGELRERLWLGELWSLAERGEITEEAFWMRFGQMFGLSEHEAHALAEDLWNTWVVDGHLLRIIDQLRDRYRIAMLSNATDVLEEYLEKRYGVADRFEAIVNSSKVGVAKPDPVIYHEMLQRLALEPNQVMFIDDRPENVAAAASLGMHVVWYINAQELERRLVPYLKK